MGVPVISPVPVSSVSPAGSAGLTDHAIGAVPPVAVTGEMGVITEFGVRLSDAVASVVATGAL